MRSEMTHLKHDSTGLGQRLNPVWSIVFSGLIALPAKAQEAVEDIRDVKDLVEIPEPPNYALWFAIALGALILGFLLWKILTRPKKSRSASAADTAISEIDAARPLVDEPSPEPLANAVTAAVRRYIESRFGIAAPNQTTEEFLQNLQAKPNPEIAPFREDLSRFLRFCDAVKFGRSDVATENREKLITSARRFVESSRNATAPEQAPEKQTPPPLPA